MKQIFILSIYIYLVSASVLAQTQYNVTTPKGSTVIAYKPGEMSNSERSSTDSYFASAYPNATQMTTYSPYSSSNRFNCHGYAWYMAENAAGLSDPRWIGYYYTTDEDIYMSDGSYVQVAGEMYPGKVSWGSGDHSAITTSTTGRYISKWNKYPLFNHQWNDTPYGTSNLKYYVSTKVTASTGILCYNSSATFSARSIPGATYTWNVGSGLTVTSNGSATATITANGSYNGASWVEVTIASPIGGGVYDTKTSKRESVWLGPPVLSYIQGPTSVQQNTYYTYYAMPTDPNVNATYYWYVYPSNGPYSSYTSTTNAKDIAFAYNGHSTLVVTSQNQCGWGFDEPNHEIEVGYGLLSLSPNPASDVIAVNLPATRTEKSSGKSETIYSIRIYDENGLPAMTAEQRTASFNLPVQKLVNGIYTMHVIVDGKVYQHRFVVKH